MLLRSLYDCEATLQWVGHLGNIFKTIFDRNGFNVSHSPSHQPVRTLYTWYTSYPFMRKYLGHWQIMKENNYFFVQIFLVCVKKDAEEK